MYSQSNSNTVYSPFQLAELSEDGGADYEYDSSSFEEHEEYEDFYDDDEYESGNYGYSVEVLDEIIENEIDAYKDEGDENGEGIFIGQEYEEEDEKHEYEEDEFYYQEEWDDSYSVDQELECGEHHDDSDLSYENSLEEELAYYNGEAELLEDECGAFDEENDDELEFDSFLDEDEYADTGEDDLVSPVNRDVFSADSLLSGEVELFAVEDQIRRGIESDQELTDMVFYSRYPYLADEIPAKLEEFVEEEWWSILKNVVRKAKRRTSSSQSRLSKAARANGILANRLGWINSLSEIVRILNTSDTNVSSISFAQAVLNFQTNRGFPSHQRDGILGSYSYNYIKSLFLKNDISDSTTVKPAGDVLSILRRIKADGGNDKYGANAVWERGIFTGFIDLVVVKGTRKEVKISTKVYPFIKKLMAAARLEDQTIKINSGFRTYPEQKALFQKYGRPRAAFPGRSNHQNGIAFDLSGTRTGKDKRNGIGDTNLYRWLAKNATKYGFVRTVSYESWHWEYRPNTARSLRERGEYRIWK